MDAAEFLASVLREKNLPSSAHSDTPKEEDLQEASDAREEEGRQEASQGLDGCSDAEASRSDNSSDDSSDNSSDEASLGYASNDDSFEGDTEDSPKFSRRELAEAAGLASQYGSDSSEQIEVTSSSSSEDFDDEGDDEDEDTILMKANAYIDPSDMDRTDFTKTAEELYEEGRRSSSPENSPAVRKYMAAVDAIKGTLAAGGSMSVSISVFSTRYVCDFQ